MHEDCHGGAGGTETASEGSPVVYEASWAPQDPRDRLYDETATKAERTMSLIRIVAAFHPVLNFFVLLGGVAQKAPWYSLIVLAVLSALGYWWWNNLS